MIVDDLDVSSSVRCPDETDLPLLINADAVLSFPIIFKSLKAIPWRHFQIVKDSRPIQLRQFPHSLAFNVHPALHALALEKSLGVSALEVLNRHVTR